jgi:RNA polymerase sigma-70 factor (ECF subfamily)
MAEEPLPNADASGAVPRSADELFARYAERLARLAERHLNPRLSGRVDGEDVVQSAFRTFFRRQELGEFRIDSSEQLWALLAEITVRKAIAKVRFHTAGKRDARAEAGSSGGPIEPTDRQPEPDDVSVVEDLIEVSLRGLPDLYADLLRLRLAGHTYTEIAARLGVSERTVYRSLDYLRERLSRHLEV